ncbi:MAG: monovalent cation/H+ antiporter complex subunit F [Solirubrobacteraceae bacterium]
MNEWEIAAAVLGVGLIPCLAVTLLAAPTDGLAALQVAAVLLSTILVLLCEGFHRQPFIDLAVVFAPMSLIGSLTFARLMERNL